MRAGIAAARRKRSGPVTACRLIVNGRVQGVFYRDWAVETARSLGVTGWVRNRAYGTVEAHLEGEAESLRRLTAAMREGPERARIERIDQGAAEPEGLDRFERR